MALKKYDLEIAESIDAIEEKAHEIEREKLLLENEMSLAVHFSEGLRLLGQPAHDYMVIWMIDKYKEYQSMGYDRNKALIATLWWAAKVERISDKKKVEKVIQTFITFDPSNRVNMLKFRKNHKYLVILGYLLWCVAIFVVAQFVAVMLTSDIFLRMFIPTIITVWYFMFTVSSLKQKKY